MAEEAGQGPGEMMNRRKLIAGMVAGLMLSAGSVMADEATDQVARGILAQLRAQGFSNFAVETTWLGRLRVVAERGDGRREIVANPRTGEILRDVWTGANGQAKAAILDRGDEGSGSSNSGSSNSGSSNSGSGSSGGSDDNSGSGSGDSGSDDSGSDDSGSDNSGSGGSGSGSSGSDDSGSDDKGSDDSGSDDSGSDDKGSDDSGSDDSGGDDKGGDDKGSDDGGDDKKD